MKRNIKNIAGSVVFVSIALVLLTAISYMLRPIQVGCVSRLALTGFYGEDKNTLDVVGLGSSALYRYLDNPVLWEEYGITSYNLATSSQQTYIRIPLIKEVLKTQDPDLFILETRGYVRYQEEEEWQDVRFRFVSDNMNYSLNRLRMICDYTSDWQERFNLFFDIMYYHGEWENLSMKQVKLYDNKEKRAYKGWKNIYQVKAMDPIQNPDSYEDLQAEPIDEEQEQELVKVLEFCKENGLNVIFVATPWQLTKEVAAQNLYLDQIISEYGYEFLDTNRYIDEMDLDYQTDFYNKRHMNAWGAAKFTKFFGSYLLENYDMDLTHSDETIREWDKAAEKNKANIEKYLNGDTETEEDKQQEVSGSDEN